MHTLLELGLYREAIIASRQILNHAGMDDAATQLGPVYFNRIRFGPYLATLSCPKRHAMAWMDCSFYLWCGKKAYSRHLPPHRRLPMG